MRELGFVPGTKVAVVRRGALGDPIEVELRGYRVCVRRADLAVIRVHPSETES
jgi:Fe2+ transport system protein FeoA